ncbi:MAG: hypothetical protein KDK34_24290, partial [Leptospiraceae bacterium]|nr:hypothetical protein [Leptospiraceae bacterium]
MQAGALQRISVEGMDFAPNGDLYVFTGHKVLRIDRAGVITHIAGNEAIVGFNGKCTIDSLGDGGLATQACLAGGTGAFAGYYPWYRNAGIDVTSSGDIYIADTWNHRIRKIDQSGIITTVAGSGPVSIDHSISNPFGQPSTFSGDRGPATQARLSLPHDVAVTSTGFIVIADTRNERIRAVLPDGDIVTIAGRGTSCPEVDYVFPNDELVKLPGVCDGYLARYAPVGRVRALALAPDGIYFASMNRIRKIDFQGVIHTVAGNGAAQNSGDGGKARDAGLAQPRDLAVAPDGTIYVTQDASFGNGRECIVRKISPDGIISTVAGTGTCGGAGPSNTADNMPAARVNLSAPFAIAVAPDGRVYFSDAGKIRTIEHAQSS